ncbi:MAG: hypothetical protein J0M12_08805 [Deltaproteobacteria bacterium]|nr:hypothetical protein [Deltaproteobacteria bacterium]
MDSAEERKAPVLQLRGPERLLGTRSVSGPTTEAARFENFMASVRERIDQLAKAELSSKQLGREVLTILRQIIREDSDPTTHDDAVETLFHRLWGEPVMQKLFVDLHNRACAILHTSHNSIPDMERDVVAAELEQIVSWYERRKFSLAMLREQKSADDAIFGLQVFHDRSHAGVDGFEVSCGLGLVGHRNEELWLKVFVRSFGEYVFARDGWEHWIDDTETLVRAVVPVGTSQEELRVSSIVPISPPGQRSIFDTVRCFLPYAALDLPAGRQDVVIEVGLFDSRGRCLLSDSQSELVSIPATEEIIPIPSPQSVGLWPSNVSSGDSISRVKIQRGFRDESREVLTILSNIDLAGHRGEALSLECRFMNLQGELVESGLAAMMEPDGSFLFRSELMIMSDLWRVYERAIEIPLAALSLDAGSHDLLCQLTLVDATRRVLCGTFERFSLEIQPESIAPQAPLHEQDALMESPDPMSDLQIGAFSIEPESRFNGTSVITLGLTLHASEWRSKVCRVVLSIEQDPLTTPSTKLRLRPQRHTLCCGGFQMPARHSISAQFSAHEIASYLLLPPEGVKLLARAQVYTLDDRLIFNRTRPFVLRQQEVSGSSQVAAFAGSAGARIVRLETRPIVGSLTIATDMSVNVRLDDSEACRFSVYHEILDPQGHAVKQHRGQDVDLLPGSVLSLDFTENAFPCRYRNAWFQFHLDLQNSLSPSGKDSLPQPGVYTLKAMLFTEQGKLVHVVHQPLLVRGKNFAESPLAISYDFDKAVVLDVDGVEDSLPLLTDVMSRVKNWVKAFNRSA